MQVESLVFKRVVAFWNLRTLYAMIMVQVTLVLDFSELYVTNGPN
jgi:hypothetical protein